MTTQAIDKLATLINLHRDAILASWRKQVRLLPSARLLDVPSLNDHMPVLLVELAAALQTKSEQTIPEVPSTGSAPGGCTEEFMISRLPKKHASWTGKKKGFSAIQMGAKTGKSSESRME